LKFKTLNRSHRREKDILLEKTKKPALPEKPRLLKQLKTGKFNIPDGEPLGIWLLS